MWICLLILSIVFVTVPLFISLITDFLDKNEIELSWLSKESVTTYIATFAAFIVNLTLIPYCIYFMSLMEDWKTKSERQAAWLNRYFIFMLLNSLLLPLTSMTTIKSLLQDIGDE